MLEVWKDIPNYEGFYQVSNLGNVKSMQRTKKHSYNSIAQLKEKMLRPQNTNGYLFVRLSKNNEIKRYLVHRLVALTFIPNPNDYLEVNHIDENSLNNNVENLEWCSHKYNINYGTGNERRSKTEIKTKRGDYFVH